MDTFEEDIRSFANRILAYDMRNDLLQHQQDSFGKYIKNCLPLDTVSKSYPVAFTQLMKSVGNAHDDILEKLDANAYHERQNYMLMCVAGARGMGKTHLAFSIGRKRSCILIRICEPRNGAVNCLSRPWQTAYERLLSAREATFSEWKSQRAKRSLRVVELLIYCYVEATCIATECAENEDAKRELVLRYHRNSESEGHIQSLFVKRFGELKQNDDSRLLDDNLCMEYFQRVSDLATSELDEGLVLCLDEILALAHLCEDQFVSNAHYNDQRFAYDDTSKIESVETKVESVENVNRGLLHATLCSVRSICRERNWRTFVTGTSLSLSRFRSHPYNTSSLRGSTVTHAPTQLLNVTDMIELLKHYFHWDRSAFDSDQVHDALKLCSGRPLFFEQCVFHRLLGRVIEDTGPLRNVKMLTGTVLIDIINYNDVKRDMLNSRFTEVFKTDPVALGPNFCRTTKSLLAPLLEALLTNDHITLTEQQMADAICIGIFPIAQTNQRTGFCGLEPLVREVLLDYIQSEGPEIENILLQTLDSSGKGFQAEKLLARRIALKSLLHSMRNNKVPISLYDLLESLLPREQRLLLHSDFKKLFCHVDTVKDLHGVDKSDTFLRHLVCPRKRKGVLEVGNFVRLWKDTFMFPHKDTSKLDYRSILINIDNAAGVDLCFLVTYETCDIQPNTPCHVVALQVKNQAEGALNEALISLHPGTQYMTKAQRNYFLAHFTGNGEPKFPNERSGVSGSKWQRHQDFSGKYPFLCKDWIRVVVVGRPIDNAVLTKVHDLPIITSEKPEFEQKYGHRLMRSLIAVVTMKDINDIDPTLLRSVVTDTSSVLSLPTEDTNWVPLEVSDVVKLLKKKTSS